MIMKMLLIKASALTDAVRVKMWFNDVNGGFANRDDVTYVHDFSRAMTSDKWQRDYQNNPHVCKIAKKIKKGDECTEEICPSYYVWIPPLVNRRKLRKEFLYAIHTMYAAHFELGMSIADVHLEVDFGD